jgi:hypothetical protein
MIQCKRPRSVPRLLSAEERFPYECLGCRCRFYSVDPPYECVSCIPGWIDLTFCPPCVRRMVHPEMHCNAPRCVHECADRTCTRTIQQLAQIMDSSFGDALFVHPKHVASIPRLLLEYLPPSAPEELRPLSGPCGPGAAHVCHACFGREFWPFVWGRDVHRHLHGSSSILSVSHPRGTSDTSAAGCTMQKMEPDEPIYSFANGEPSSDGRRTGNVASVPSNCRGPTHSRNRTHGTALGHGLCAARSGSPPMCHPPPQTVV